MAAHWTGRIKTVAFCEIESYCQKVLQKHWPDVPIFEDITKLRGEDVGAVDIVCGGDPCQPHSNAGKRMGLADERYLWPEMFRLIREIQPTWVVNENVPGSLSNGVVSQKIYDLESQGYSTQPFSIPAFSVGTRFWGARIVIVATPPGIRRNCMDENQSKRCSKLNIQMLQKRFDDKTHIPIDIHGLLSNPVRGVLRNDNGISQGLDRIKACGNAVVPHMFYPIFQAIVDIEARRRYTR